MAARGGLGTGRVVSGHITFKSGTVNATAEAPVLWNFLITRLQRKNHVVGVANGVCAGATTRRLTNEIPVHIALKKSFGGIRRSQGTNDERRREAGELTSPSL